VDTERVGLLVLRAWTEKGSSVPLRVRISKVEDLGESLGPVEVITATTPEQACDIVLDWLKSRLDG
jgi:hypothetical protein